MFNEEHFNRFISFIFDPDDGCMELACWGGYQDSSNTIKKSTYPTSLCGWFDNRKYLRNYARRFAGVSAYVTINPVTPTKLAQCANHLEKLKKNEGTSTSDIVKVKYALIDIDYDRRNSKISATSHELQECLTLRNRILDEQPTIGDYAIYGCSGNGAYILLKIGDNPNNQKTVAEVRELLMRLAHHYGKKGNGSAYIDTHPHFQNVHIGLPGTMKCKGESTTDRPHRMITVDGGF